MNAVNINATRTGAIKLLQHERSRSSAPSYGVWMGVVIKTIALLALDLELVNVAHWNQMLVVMLAAPIAMTIWTRGIIAHHATLSRDTTTTRSQNE